MSVGGEAGPLGAYGLRVTGLPDIHTLLGPVPEHFPPLHLAQREEPRPFPRSSVEENRVTFALGHGRGLVVERPTACATYWGARPPTAADLVHPLLTAAAAAVGRWSGYELFHAAAFVAGERVWGILGDRESGKSSMAGALAGRGYPVVCDDLLAVQGRIAFAGPRCVDLRDEAARRLGVGVEVHTEGPRERWRMRFPPIDAQIPLGGWVVLRWADEVETVPLGPGQLLRRLAAGRTWHGLPTNPVTLLDLATLPGWELGRPRSWESFPSVVTTVEALTTRTASAPAS